MSPVIWSLDHKSCPFEIMERVNVTPAKLPGFYRSLGLNEAVWLQTCNRRELISCGPEFPFAAFGGYFGAEPDKYIKRYEGLEAVRHLFRTAAGLNSAMPGESQVLGQVRDAYLKSKELGASGKFTEKLFSAAIHAGRFARLKSGISIGAVSAAQAAVEIAGSRIDLKGKKVLVIGAGKINSSAAKYLKKAGADIIFVSSRSKEKADKLAKMAGAWTIGFELLHEAVMASDLVISATSAPHYVLHGANARAAINNRQGKLLIVDLAVPRDVDPSLASDKAEILNMDDINRLTESNMEKRFAAALIAEDSVELLARRWVYETENRDKKKPFGAYTSRGINPDFETQPQRA